MTATHDTVVCTLWVFSSFYLWQLSVVRDAKTVRKSNGRRLRSVIKQRFSICPAINLTALTNRSRCVMIVTSAFSKRWGHSVLSLGYATASFEQRILVHIWPLHKTTVTQFTLKRVQLLKRFMTNMNRKLSYYDVLIACNCSLCA